MKMCWETLLDVCEVFSKICCYWINKFAKMTVLSKVLCITMALVKMGVGMHQVDVTRLSSSCQYLEIAPHAGWWCCPFQSIPVEEFRGIGNMSQRAYNYPRAECETIYPPMNMTQGNILRPATSDGDIGVWIVVGLICSCLIVVVFITSSVVHYRRMRHLRLQRPNVSTMYLRAPRIDADTIYHR